MFAMKDSMLHPQDIAVILLNYKGGQDTVACLRALYALTTSPKAIIVVDNASPDNSIQQIMTAWQQWATPRLIRTSTDRKVSGPATALLLQLEYNNGYASGNNAGIQLAKSLTPCTAYWLLNNDTEPDSHALDAMCERYNTTNCPAIVGSTLVFNHDKITIQCTGGNYLNSMLGITTALHQGKKLTNLSLISTEETEKSLGDITGASLLIHEDVLQRIGLLREDFFLYLEDTDFGIRARKAGIPLLWARNSIVFHKEGGSTGATSVDNTFFQRPAWVDYLMLRNRVRMVQDHYPPAIPLLCVSYIAVAAKRVLRGQADRIPLVFKALWHGLTGKMGKPDTQI